ncbi:MAG: NERD domain-containing protein [Clostridia bacterium]|nr:NERD domain-containing protein [Clostridia bacterium]
MYNILVVIFVITIFILGNPKVKGSFGEAAVKVYLSRLDKEKYRILHDVMISNDKGSTSQIDHVIVSPFGIFVIETKNYKGWILGNEKSYQWAQVIYKKKEKLLNPILQNHGHVKALKALLKDYPDIEYHPIVKS